jgi:hypothetical protein
MILAGAKCLGSEVTLSISIHYKEVLYYVTLIESSTSSALVNQVCFTAHS